MSQAIAIVGRPNVGKSTFFNRLTKSRDALVVDRPGVTRDRQYGVGIHKSRSFLVIDTGGIGEEDHDSEEVAELMTQQSMQAAEECAVLIWIVDGTIGLSHVDETLSKTFRKMNKPLFLAVNKLEGHQSNTALTDFYSLGIDNIYPISALRGDGIETLLNNALELLPENEIVDDETSRLTISVLGRPNVGKSTLVNRMIGEERVLTFDHPGTTRDSIRVPFTKNKKEYVLIDTAGVRRKSKVNDLVEKFSVIKSFDAISSARITILVIDASEGVTDQDSALLGMIEDAGKAVIIVANKWDGLDSSDKESVKAQLSRKFSFIDYAQYHYISALHGTGVGNIFKTINKIEKCLSLDVSTSDMTKILGDAVKAHPPQLVRGRRIKLRYAHLGGLDPIRIIIHGNQTKSVPDNYTRYLAGVFRKRLKLIGTPVLIEYKHSDRDNPYKDKKNKLTQRQINKRKRLMKHVKRK